MRQLKILVFIFSLALFLVLDLKFTDAKSDPGKTNRVLNSECNVHRQMRALYADSKICVRIECKNQETEPLFVTISWTLTERQCWYDESALLDDCIRNENLLQFNHTNEPTYQSPQVIVECSSHSTIELPQLPAKDTNAGAGGATSSAIKAPDGSAPVAAAQKPETAAKTQQQWPPLPMKACKPIFVTDKDGIYDLVVTIEAQKQKADFSAFVVFDTKGPYGYIPAVDFPLLPFYGIMCITYVVFGIIWLVVSFLQWRDLLRIQFWIGGVILLGMLEKAFFYAQYQALNNTGEPVISAELTAEFVSCAKRTLARMLVIIMSLGFGIVKPRLGPMLHRVVGVGALYFVLACVESYLRVMRTKTDERNELLVASIPLAVLDTGICWWIFTSLVQTTRTLRLRRNMVKLTLYRHFTNTLIFSVIASVFFMMYAMRLRKIENCTPFWRDIWIDTGFWHILFSVLLLVIMILWRPTNNNQRYAFTPLLDNPEDEDDEEEEDQFVADTYGVKMRGAHSNGGTRTPPANQRNTTTTEEDDLRWVEENIPSAIAEPALPVLDSDEEIINTKFEVSKMQ